MALGSSNIWILVSKGVERIDLNMVTEKDTFSKNKRQKIVT